MAAEITTTTNTPTATPRMVRPARTRFDLIDSSAMPTPSNRPEIQMLNFDMLGLVPHGGDGIEQRRAARRIDARDDADARADADADEDRPDLDRGGQRRDRRDQFGEPDSKQNAENGAEYRERRRFDEELVQDVAAACTERFSNADLAGAFGNGDEHDVHD